MYRCSNVLNLFDDGILLFHECSHLNIDMRNAKASMKKRLFTSIKS